MLQGITKLASVSFTVAALAAVVGCSSQGLSTRETGMQTYSAVVAPAPQSAMSYATGVEAVPTTGPVQINLPARISVVQIGEIAPPQATLTALRSHKDLFQRVSPQNGTAEATTGTPHERLGQMREMAGNLGADYLLIFGGNIDAGHQDTALALVNLTIVGGFIVPSAVVHVDGKAAGSLVDVRTGRVLMNFSSETAGNGIVPSFFADNTETASVESAKSTLAKQLTEDVIRQMTEQKPAPIAAMVK